MLDCPIIEVGWYKKQSGVEHEFLWFNISSPDNMHTSIVISKRVTSVLNPNRDASDAMQPTDTITPPIPADTVISPNTLPEAVTPPFSPPDVAGDSMACSASKSSPHVDKATKTHEKTKKKRHPPHISALSSSLQWGSHDC
ncbi:hypothetical protein EDD17DRAFT_1769710 [Pisolithus thermaeus]|nr:hypothetical protein EV401DRAFT_2077839 [Pisolithus croceorrhizus]KAI6141550.1 hypothetical protein EDD17DRAFT_1769710 [Pisolithus thermaeus]